VKEYTDAEIIRCLKERQSDVVRYLFKRYMPMIRLMVTQMGGSVEDAKDLFQDGLIIMLEKMDKDELVLRCKFKTFFYSAG
jgi:DNA-directed RNA polymerase specialized sigma subunit